MKFLKDIETVRQIPSEPLYRINTGPYVQISIEHPRPIKINVNQIFKEMTCFISFTRLKTHEEATMSASLKNMALSWPSKEEHGSPP